MALRQRFHLRVFCWQDLKGGVASERCRASRRTSARSVRAQSAKFEGQHFKGIWMKHKSSPHLLLFFNENARISVGAEDR